MIQLAHLVLINAAVKSTFTWSNGTSFSCFLTSSAYQAWNLFFISSFIGLLTETSKGCNLSVQFAGTSTAVMLCFPRRDRISGVVWPQKPSNIARAG